MDLKYKILFLLLFTFFDIQANKILMYYENLNNIKNEYSIFGLIILNLLEEDEDIVFIREDFKSSVNVRDDVVLVKAEKDRIIFSFLDSLKKEKYSFNFEIEKYLNNLNVFEDEKKEKVYEIKEIIKNNFDSKKQQPILQPIQITKSNINFKFEFPNFSMGISGVSYKLFNDERANIFSIFPINVLMTFFPYKNIEFGMFYRFSYDSSVFLYKKNDSYNQKLIMFDMEYGFLFGYTSIYENTIFTIGFSFFNKTFIMEEKRNMKYINNYSRYFLPQFSLFQKLNIQLSKNIYYTIFINIKSAQMYKYNEPFFYGDIFDYNLFVLEISFFGVSLIF